MNNYVFFVDLPLIENDFFFYAEDTVMKPPPVDLNKLKKNEVAHVDKRADTDEKKVESHPSLQFVLDDVKKYEHAIYENCDIPISNLFYHCHNLFEVTVVLSGKGYYFVNGEAIEVRNGSVVVFNRLVPHAWIASEDEPPIQRSFNFYPSLMLEKELSLSKNTYIKEYLDNMTYFHTSKSESLFLWNMLDEIYMEFQKKERGYDSCIKNLIMTFLILQSRNTLPAQSGLKKGGILGKELEKAINYMRNNFQNNITLKDVSDQIYMHPNYFSSCFKKKCGVSFTYYMNMLKVAMASELMQSTILSIEEIAKQCGFSSLSNFYRVFKDFYKISPVQYSKKR